MRLRLFQNIAVGIISLALVFRTNSAGAAALEIVKGVELQPLAAQVQRLVEAMDFLGTPFNDEEKSGLRAAAGEADPAKGVTAIQKILDPHCLAGVQINPEMRVKVAQGEAQPQL